MLDKEQELYALYQKYEDLDHWGNAAIIEGKKQFRDEVRNRVGDLDSLPTDEEIEQHYYYRCLSFVHEQFANIGRAVREKNTAWLSENVRYDQHLSLELYELVTGRKVRGLSNKKLRVVFAGL